MSKDTRTPSLAWAAFPGSIFRSLTNRNEEKSHGNSQDAERTIGNIVLHIFYFFEPLKVSHNFRKKAASL